MRSRSILFLSLVLSLAACQPEAASLSEDDRAAIRANIQAQVEAGLAADWETFFSVFADDAVLMLPNLPGAEGMNAIREIDWVSAIEWEQSISEIEGLGDAALVKGTFTLLLDMDGAVRDQGKYLQVWRKETDGSWRITEWISNSDLPLPSLMEGEHQEEGEHN
jgi:ketosteroid isomerase-like protein